MTQKKRNGLWLRSKETQEKMEIRSKLMQRARRGDINAQKVLAEAPYRIKVFTVKEIEAYETEIV